MNTEQILSEVREANLAFMTMAQRLIKANREEAKIALGINDAIATRFEELTPAQLLTASKAPTLFSRFAIDDVDLLERLDIQAAPVSRSDVQRPVV